MRVFIADRRQAEVDAPQRNRTLCSSVICRRAIADRVTVTRQSTAID
jgi:hypothetical protein